MRPWQRKQASARRAPLKRVAVTVTFTTDDLQAVAHQMNIDEPSPANLRRFASVAIDRELARARERYAERPLEDADAGSNQWL